MASVEKRYPDAVMRPGILPGILGSVAILLGLWLVGTEWEFAVRLAASILAAIVVVFCVQARQRKYIVPGILVGIIVVTWNPVCPVARSVQERCARGWGWLTNHHHVSHEDNLRWRPHNRRRIVTQRLTPH